MNLRPRLTYANVVATLALVLALGGGTVYAAVKLGKNEVKSKNIAKGAVKGSDLSKNAVTSPKVKNGSIEAGDLAAGVIPQIAANVTGTATGGPQGGISVAGQTPLPLSGTTTFTPQPGEVAAVAAEAQFTIATTNALNFCRPSIRILLNGQPTVIFVAPDADGNNTTPLQSLGRDASGPYGLINPGTPLTVTATLNGDPDCTPASQLDRVEVRILQFR